MCDVQVVVGAVIVDDLDHPTQILAARRTAGASSSVGRWEFPGGKVETDETPTDALRRELVEELAVETVVGVELGGGAGWPIADGLVLRLFAAEISAGVPTPGSDHDAVRWLRSDELESVVWLDSDRAALPSVRALLEVVGRSKAVSEGWTPD